VSILFADIAGFTAYSSSVTPSDVVHMLRNLFECIWFYLSVEFDMLCIKKKVFKLYTIGDCYVVIGILDNNVRDPVQEAVNVVEMGYGMINIIDQVKKKINFDGLEMRIGIHTVILLNSLSISNIFSLLIGQYYRWDHWN